MRKRQWTQRDRWNTLAFREYRDSREWRYLLALNPSYDIRYKPAPGVMIHTSGSIGAGKDGTRRCWCGWCPKKCGHELGVTSWRS